MKTLSNSAAVRAAAATTLSFVLITSWPAAPLAVGASRRPASINLRSESQLRSEATSYERALGQLSQILTMKLDTNDDLKKANAIFEREHANLKFLLARFFVIAIEDSAFTNAVKNKVPDQKSAEEFGKELGRDPASIFKLNGATSLKTRLLQKAQTDAATLRRIGDRLKQAADKLKKVSGRVQDREAPGDFKPIRASFRTARLSAPLTYLAAPDSVGDTIVPLLIVVVLDVPGGLDAAAVGAVVLSGPISLAIVAGLAAATIAQIIENYGTQEGRDKIARCMDSAEARLNQCRLHARGNLVEVLLVAACDSEWLLDAAKCQLNP